MFLVVEKMIMEIILVLYMLIILLLNKKFVMFMIKLIIQLPKKLLGKEYKNLNLMKLIKKLFKELHNQIMMKNLEVIILIWINGLDLLEMVFNTENQILIK